LSAGHSQLSFNQFFFAVAAFFSQQSILGLIGMRLIIIADIGTLFAVNY
jgi:hypothetical protein